MKKVRFETPDKSLRLTMDSHSECHSPRPCIEKQDIGRSDVCYEYTRLLPYNPDPVQRYECSNSSPYPMIAKTSVEGLCSSEPRSPSNDLDLSMLDSSYCEPRQPIHSRPQQFLSDPKKRMFDYVDRNMTLTDKNPYPTHTVLSSIENTKILRNVGNNGKENNFFIKRDNLSKRYPENINSLQSQLNRLSLQKENDPLGKKAELMRMAAENKPVVNIQPKAIQQPVVPAPSIPDECRCHHCVKIIQNAQCNLRQQMGMSNDCPITNNFPRMEPQCACMQKQQPICPCSLQTPIQPSPNTCDCPKMHGHINQPKNAVDKKSWMIEKYEQNQKHEGMEVEKQNTVIKEKREPTVSDLFKIIKLQNEQLQLLQEKVDKFITASAGRSVNTPQNYVTEHVALESVDSEQHKISIGVMTSFEMVRTSTVINKEIVTQTNENAQIQCNRSQISIKEVVSKSHPGTLNFLDGIIPQRQSPSEYTEESTQNRVYSDTKQQTENMNDDKTLNELSLYNVQVDNATTPLISPEQSLYLDVRDYSELVFFIIISFDEVMYERSGNDKQINPYVTAQIQAVMTSPMLDGLIIIKLW